LSEASLVVLATAYGDIVVELDHLRAPKTAAHFRMLVADGWLDRAAFYRVVHKAQTPGKLPTIDVIQGGVGEAWSPDVPTVEHEPTTMTGLRHVEGAVSLAKGADQPASSEFFITLGEFPALDAGVLEGPAAQGFAVFGRVVSGLDVAHIIHQLPAEAPPPPGWDVNIFKNQFLNTPTPMRPRLG
jgi:peptidyl-prolyl cis-trans isomerase A (cyclophilin A)